jgi:hypothetical protein
LPLSDIAQGYTECPGALLRFLVEVERGTVASLVKLGFIRPEQRDDLGAILVALKRVGQPPTIWRAPDTPFTAARTTSPPGRW